MKHSPITPARSWNCYSAVSDCNECDGHGEYRNGVTCHDCHGSGHTPCPVCGFDVPVAGYDCLVCYAVGEMTPAQMKAINSADIADAFAAAVNAALNAQVAA